VRKLSDFTGRVLTYTENFIAEILYCQGVPCLVAVDDYFVWTVCWIVVGVCSQ